MTTSDLEVFAAGEPIPQGSMTGLPIKGTRRIVVQPSNKKALYGWRDTIISASFNAIAAQHYQPAEGPLQVDLTFYFDRPGYHFGTGRNARTLKPGAPTYVAVFPDIDKLIRAVLDAFTKAGVYTDDSRVVKLAVAQLYIQPGQQPGVLARVRPVVHEVLLPTLGAPREEWPTVATDPPSLFDD